jgi:hypothetical protein
LTCPSTFNVAPQHGHSISNVDDFFPCGIPALLCHTSPVVARQTAPPWWGGLQPARAFRPASGNCRLKAGRGQIRSTTLRTIPIGGLRDPASRPVGAHPLVRAAPPVRPREASKPGGADVHIRARPSLVGPALLRAQVGILTRLPGQLARSGTSTSDRGRQTAQRQVHQAVRPAREGHVSHMWQRSRPRNHSL